MSRFNLTAVRFFGKVFGNGSISPDPEKVSALHVAEPPESVAKVRSFLFLAGANADFMKGITRVTAPLRALMKREAEFRQTTECFENF